MTHEANEHASYTGENRRKSKDETKFTDVEWHDKWKPILAIVYAAVIIFDFILLPAYKVATQPSFSDIVHQIAVLDVEEQKSALAVARPEWQPLSMFAGGMFHIAMGAILTGAAVAGRGGLSKLAK